MEHAGETVFKSIYKEHIESDAGNQTPGNMLCVLREHPQTKTIRGVEEYSEASFNF